MRESYKVRKNEEAVNDAKMASLWFVVAVTVLSVGHASATCSIHHLSLQNKFPLLLADNSYEDVRRFIRADTSSNTDLKAGETITLVCPGTYNYLSGGNVPLQQIVKASCVSGYSYAVDGRTITLNQVSCYANPTVEVRIRGECRPNTIAIEVGYNIPTIPTYFLKLYEVCYDNILLTPTSTQHLVVAGNRGTNTGVYSAFLLPLDPGEAYTIVKQTESLTLQLDSESAKKYITSSHYLEATQLVPKDDFVFGPVQLSAFYYFNTLPLWKPFTSSFWTTLESSIRELAYAQGDLEVYTSVLAVGVLPDSNGKEVPVYLYAKDSERYLPLPGYLSKTVLNSRSQQVIFLQVQHVPGIARSLAAEGVCAEDVCAQLRWLPWRHVPPSERPFVTCCRADDALLRRRLPLALPPDAARASSSAPGLLVGD